MGKYDPSKKYRWNPEDKFELTGEQFGMILNALRGVLSSPEAGRILAANRAHDEIERVMEVAAENDVIKEIPDEPPLQTKATAMKVVK